MDGRSTSAFAGAGLGGIAGAVLIGVALAVVGLVYAAVLHYNAIACAVMGLILGAISGAVGGAIGGWSRIASGRPTPVTRITTVSALAAFVVLFLVWGPPPERLIILALVLPCLWGGMAIGDRAGRRMLQAKPTPPGLLRSEEV